MARIWFVVTVSSGYQGSPRRLLVRARAGADVEQVVKRHGLDEGRVSVSWLPLDESKDDVVEVGTWEVLP